MNHAVSTRRARLAWWAATPLLPTIALQGSLMRRRIPKLPEAAGARSGIEGSTGEVSLSIAVIGESTAAGVGVEHQSDALGAQLARALAESRSTCVRWQSIGRTGLTIAKASRELLPELIGPVDLVVPVFGVNDTLKLTSELEWRREIVALTRALHERGAGHVLYAAAPPLDSFSVLPDPLRTVLGLRARFLNAVLRDVVAANSRTSCVCFDSLDSMVDLSHDQFHPSITGYAKWARMLADSLR